MGLPRNTRPCNVAKQTWNTSHSFTGSNPEPIIKRDAAVDDIREFYQPLWWSSEYAHVAFLSKEPPLDSGVFDFLLTSTPYIHRHRRWGHCLDPRQVLDWNRLQFNLRTVIKELASKSNLPNFPSIIDNALSCTGYQLKLNEMVALIYRSKGWFSYWISQLSFVIAASLTLDNDDVEFDVVYSDNPGDEGANGEITIPSWYQFLASRNWHQAFLSSIYSASSVFHPDASRVGIFLDVLTPEGSQYPVDWFVKFHVPVWYPWGAAERNAAVQSSSLARLAPPVHQLQMATTFISKPVSAVSQVEGGEMVYWKQWLQKRTKQESELVKCMSDLDRKSMEDRAKQPPKKRCRVFVWKVNDNGEFIRDNVVRRENEDTLAEFGRNQKIYSAVFNEWDCWDGMGQKDDDELEMEDWDDIPEDRILPPDAILSTPPPDRFDTDPGPMEINDSVQQILGTVSMEHPPSYSETDQVDLHQYEALLLLKEYYGFIAPLPLKPIVCAIELNKATKSVFRSVLGLQVTDEEFFNSDIAPHAIAFLESFSKSPGYPIDDSWDLGSNSIFSPQGTEQFKHMLRLVNATNATCEGFLFDFGAKQSVPWKIVIKDAVNALLVCRLDPQLNDYAVAFALLQRGIGFSTVLSFSEATRPCLLPSNPTLSLPVCFSGYKFTKDDYALYVQRRNRLLQNPRIGRAVLLQGGIIWRLAVEHVSFFTTLVGPTASVKSGSKYVSNDEAMFLGDDKCTHRELELICGAVVCTTSMYHFIFIIFSTYVVFS